MVQIQTVRSVMKEGKERFEVSLFMAITKEQYIDYLKKSKDSEINWSDLNEVMMGLKNEN